MYSGAGVKPGIKDNDAQTIDQAPHTETDVVGQNKIKKDPKKIQMAVGLTSLAQPRSRILRVNEPWGSAELDRKSQFLCNASASDAMYNIVLGS